MIYQYFLSVTAGITQLKTRFNSVCLTRLAHNCIFCVSKLS
ncbi:hypothetical protein BN133_4234 [Cronobacter dublinensis 582]|nr:hypothetical protein BN133_4234 [Cronobacter dublinensis 582]